MIVVRIPPVSPGFTAGSLHIWTSLENLQRRRPGDVLTYLAPFEATKRRLYLEFPLDVPAVRPSPATLVKTSCHHPKLRTMKEG